MITLNSLSQHSINYRAVRFGAVYGIEGTSNRGLSTNPDTINPRFPTGAVDPQVEDVFQKVKAKAQASGTPISDLIVTRAGTPFRGEPDMLDELRLVLTEQDAVDFAAKRPEITRIIDSLEKNDENREIMEDTLLTIFHKELAHEQQLSLFNWSRGQKKPELSAQEKGAKAFAQKRLAELKQELVTLGNQYHATVRPVLDELRSKVRGYLPVTIVADRLEQGSFDVVTGGQVEEDKAKEWWYQ